MLPQHFPAIFVDLAEPDCAESCPFCGKGKSADLMPENKSKCVGFSGILTTPF
jgi:hypothetical protein